MHPESLDEMRKQLDHWESDRAIVDLDSDTSPIVVDIGCMDINGLGTYRQLIPKQWGYIGLDREFGPNVTAVMEDEFNTGLPDDYADIVLCGQVLEHCRDPHRLVKEIYRILKPNCRCYLVAPALWEKHRCPIDCWRIQEDGMIALLKMNNLQVLGCFERPQDVGLTGIDTWGIGLKL